MNINIHIRPADRADFISLVKNREQLIVGKDFWIIRPDHDIEYYRTNPKNQEVLSMLRHAIKIRQAFVIDTERYELEWIEKLQHSNQEH